MNSYEKQMVAFPCFASRARLEARGASCYTGLSVYLLGCRDGIPVSSNLEPFHNGGWFTRLLGVDLQILD
jgi:hypothetical protein